GRTLFFVAAHVKVPMARPPVGKPMNEPWVAVEGENNWLVRGKQSVEIVIREAMWMLSLGLQLHEIHDVDNTHLQFGGVLSEEVHGSQSLQCRHVSAASHHDVGFLATVAAGPFPDSKPGGAVPYRLVDRQPLWGRLFASDDDIYIVSAAQAMVRH